MVEISFKLVNSKKSYSMKTTKKHAILRQVAPTYSIQCSQNIKICLPKELTSQNNDDPDEVSVITFFVNIQDDNGIRVIIFQKILK